jgi:hypothetical protein
MEGTAGLSIVIGLLMAAFVFTVVLVGFVVHLVAGAQNRVRRQLDQSNERGFDEATTLF